MSWFKSVLDSAQSGFGKYLESGEWVGDVIGGVGAGIAAHSAAEEAKDLAEQRREMHYASAPATPIALSKGLLTKEGLLTGGK